ncbi:MAG: hypothetical protein ACLP1D_13270 [Xanthobacteraceae bacterium]
MTDPLQDVLAPAAVERALEIYRQMRDCSHTELVQARKCATARVFALIDAGERDEQQLVIGALKHLKTLERARAANHSAKPAPEKSGKPLSGARA